MPSVTSCGCCNLLQGCIITGVYTGVVYLAAFIMELCLVLKGEGWISPERNRGSLPLPEYILVVLHFTVVGLSVIMLYALYQRRTGVLLAWVFIVSFLLFPELGIILYLVTFFWDFTNVIGMAELIFYSVRVPIYVICIICVYSLYSSWKNQTETELSLKKLTSLQMNQETSAKPLSYKNPGYLGSNSDLSMAGDPYPYGRKYGTIPMSRSRLGGSMTSLDMQKGGFLNRNYYANSQLALEAYSGGYRGWDPYIQVPYKDNRSEFNASVFPTHVNMGSMPALNHNVVPGMMFNTINPIGAGTGYSDLLDPRLASKSLLDLEYSARLSYSQQPPLVHRDYTTQSLDRRRYIRRAQSISMVPYSQAPSEVYNLNPYYGYPRHKDSKTSLGAESDDFRRYRDVAL